VTKMILTRCYSITMGTLNTSVTFFLFLMSRVNAEAGGPNVIVSIIGPAATIAFLTIAIAWFLDALHPGVMRKFVPGGKEKPHSMWSPMCSRWEAPKPLPPSAGERIRARARQAVTAHAHAVQRLIRKKRRSLS